MLFDSKTLLFNKYVKFVPAILSFRWFRGAPIVPLVVILGFITMAIFAPLLTLHDPTKTHLSLIHQPPFWQSGGSLVYPLGTDQLGRDVLSRIILGARISLIVALCAIALGGVVGTLLGIISGYWGKWPDTLLMTLADGQLSIPVIFLAMALVGVLGASLENIVFVIALTAWVRYGRIIRSEVLTLKEQGFVDLARVAGCKHRRIMLRHIFPNIVPSLIVLATLDVPRVILFEAVLSFLGLGIQPPTPTWGGMISDGRAYMTVAWWTTTIPGGVLMITAYSINLIGDWLRDRLDPALQI